MKSTIPYSKLSKKEKRKQDTSRRANWNGINPVTKVVSDKTKYDRKKIKEEKYDY